MAHTKEQAIEWLTQAVKSLRAQLQALEPEAIEERQPKRGDIALDTPAFLCKVQLVFVERLRFLLEQGHNIFGAEYGAVEYAEKFIEYAIGDTGRLYYGMAPMDYSAIVMNELGYERGDAKADNHKALSRALEAACPDIVPGTGFVVSPALCVMNSKSGWVLCARIYQDRDDGELAPASAPYAEEAQPIVLAPLPSLTAWRHIQAFVKEASEAEATQEKGAGT
jgi:hypothetical protein